MKKLLAILALTLSAGMAVGQVTITHWNFNESTGTAPNSWPSPIAASSGLGSISHDFGVGGTNGVANFGGTTLNAVGSDASGGSLSVEAGTGLINNSKSFIISVSTVGYVDLVLTYASRGTSTGFNTHTIDYSTDGTTFTNIQTFTGRNVTSFSILTVDFTAISAANNNPNFKIKVTLTGASATAGNNRFDNIKLVGTAPLSDGDGTAVVSNQSGGTLNGSDVFQSGNNNVAITITGTSAGTLTSASVSLTENWTALSEGNISLSGTGFAGAEFTLVGSVITITGASLTNTNTGTVTISSANAVQSTTTLGREVFTVKTSKSGGTLTTISNSPAGHIIVPISWVKARESGVLVKAGQYLAVKGVATVPNGALATTNTEVYIQDNTGGINVFKIGTPPTITVGNEYVVKGQLTNFNGLTEVIPSANSDIYDFGTSTPVNFELVSVPTLTGNANSYQGNYVGVQNLTMVSTKWPRTNSDSTLVFEDINNNQLTVFIDAQGNIDGSTEPTWPRDLKGIFTVKNNNPGLLLISLDDIVESNTLPVELASFTASAFGSGAKLVWSTKTEQNNAGFEVERKTTGNWTSLGFVAGKGTTNNPQSYSFIDAAVSGKASYRLKQVDTDGAFSYSPVVEFTGTPATFEVLGNYPNPFNPATVIKFNLPAEMQVTVSVFNVLGQRVAELVNGKLTAGEKSVSFNAAGLSSGVYIYRIQAGNQTVTRSMLLTK